MSLQNPQYVTYDEMKLIKEALKALEFEYYKAKNNPEIPQSLQTIADQKAEEIRKLYRRLEETKPISIHR